MRTNRLIHENELVKPENEWVKPENEWVKPENEWVKLENELVKPENELVKHLVKHEKELNGSIKSTKLNPKRVLHSKSTWFVFADRGMNSRWSSEQHTDWETVSAVSPPSTKLDESNGSNMRTDPSNMRTNWSNLTNCIG
jgi:hypothetical protein